jgi:Flp pilus assembly protein TadD
MTATRRDRDLIEAIRLHQAGRLDEAERFYRQLHHEDENDPEVIFLLGVLCCDLGIFEAAAKFLERALAIQPAFPEARRHLVVALNGVADSRCDERRFDEARQIFERSLQLAPNEAGTLKGLGRLALARGDAAAGEASLTASLQQNGEQADALNWLGLAQLQQEKFAAAEASLRGALALRPDLNQARNNLGLALHAQGRLPEAVQSFRAALSQDPLYTSARLNLANSQRVLGDLPSARRELQSILDSEPESVEALNNLGAVLQDAGEAEAARASLTRALELAPNSAAVRWNLSLSQLSLGDFEAGWQNFESRWEGCANLRGGYRLPRDSAWRGEPLQGRRLLLWAEQGFGDTLQFIRFAADLASRGAEVHLVAPSELAELLRTVPGVGTVTSLEAPLPPHDFHCPLMSLPFHLRIAADGDALRSSTPYVFAAAAKLEVWRRRLAGYPGLRVGLVWAGRARRFSAELAAIDARRSLALAQLSPLLSVAGCSFFSLQKDGGAELESMPQLHDFSAEWTDFSDTAALIMNLDLVISVDTAVAHLAGALGKNVWLLNRYDTCWRWLRQRSDSPWYATLRQFRQPQPGDWAPAIAGAASALAQFAAPAADGRAG